MKSKPVRVLVVESIQYKRSASISVTMESSFLVEREAGTVSLGCALSGGVSGGFGSRFHTLASPTASVLVVWASTSEGLVALEIPALAGKVGMSRYSSCEGSVWVTGGGGSKYLWHPAARRSVRSAVPGCTCKTTSLVTR